MLPVALAVLAGRGWKDTEDTTADLVLAGVVVELEVALDTRNELRAIRKMLETLG